jgi:PAS domain S-box-containing protein
MPRYYRYNLKIIPSNLSFTWIFLTIQILLNLYIFFIVIFLINQINIGYEVQSKKYLMYSLNLMLIISLISHIATLSILIFRRRFNKGSHDNYLKLQGIDISDISDISAISEINIQSNDQNRNSILKNDIFTQLFSSIDIDIAIFDLNGRYVYVNPNAIKSEEIRDWIIGKNDYEYCRYRNKDIHIAEKRMKSVEEVIATKQPITFQETLLNNGEEIYFYRRLTPVFDENGSIVNIIGYGLNITDSLQMQEEIDEISSNFENIVKFSPLGILVLQNSNIKFVNNKLLNTFGYDSPDELIDKSETILVTDEYKELVISYSRQRNGYQDTPESYEIQCLRKDGTIFDAIITANKIKFTRHSAILVFIKDISEKKLMERELKRKEIELFQAQKLDVLARFAGNIIHNFNNVNSIILAAIEYLDTITDDQRHRQYLQIIKNALHKSEGLINNLLDLSQRSDKSKDAKHYSINGLIEENLQLFKVLANSSISFQFNKEDENNHLVVINAMDFHQILLNIVTNAIEAIGEIGQSGQIAINTKVMCNYVSNHEEHTDHGVKVTVTDSGPGIPSDIIDKVFTPLFTTKSTGTGIGLSSTKQLVEQYNGSISFQTELNKGTTFDMFFTIPIETCKYYHQSSMQKTKYM